MIRRYSPIKPSVGTRWDPAVVQQANELHRWRCLGAVVGMPGDCAGQLEPDHIRASGAMGIDWMTGDELSQAIPPAYTEWIGQRLLASLEEAA